MKDMVSRNVCRKLESREVHDYKEPIHYIPYQEVLKPDSVSAPLRIVFNSSSPYTGHVLNEYWAKGPDILNNMFGILLWFHLQRVAIVGDIAKM